jgi:hypothetical protein
LAPVSGVGRSDAVGSSGVPVPGEPGRTGVPSVVVPVVEVVVLTTVTGTDGVLWEVDAAPDPEPPDPVDPMVGEPLLSPLTPEAPDPWFVPAALPSPL